MKHCIIVLIMLPSTGKFKEISCPFFDNGLCSRPYCHFRHVKKETADLPTNSVSSANTSLNLGDNGEILQQLVSEAVRKVLEQSDLPSALVRPSGTNAVENVSRDLVTKVTEVLVPPVASPTSSQKIPSYKPTPIAILKNRHIPIPYSPSLNKSSSVLRKKPTGERTYAIKKFKKPEEESEKPSSSLPSSPASKAYESSTTTGSDNKLSEYSSDFAQYSPAPVKGWKDNGFKYTPSSIGTLTQNTYVPSSSNSAQASLAEYEPTEKSESAVEPTYEPLATNGSTLGSASYEPSRVGNSEPEYQPLCCDITAKEYVPTDISKLENIGNVCLDVSPEIDLLNDLLHDELNDETEIKKGTGANKLDTHSGSEVSSKNLDCDKKSSSHDKPKKDSEKHKRDSNKKKTENEKKKSDVRKESEHDKKRDSKKESGNEKRKDGGGRKSESKRHSDISDDSKKRADTEKKKDDGDKKRSENPRKCERSEDKKVSSDKKHSEHHRKSDTDKKRGENEKKKSEIEKKKSENEVKRGDSDNRKSVSVKDNSSDKSTSIRDSKQSEKKSNVSSESLCSEKRTNASSDSKNTEQSTIISHSEHKHSSMRSSNEKKGDENRKRKKSDRVDSHHNKRSEEKSSKSKNGNLKRTRSDSDRHDSKKTKTSKKPVKTESSKKLFGDAVTGHNDNGNSLSDSEESDISGILDNVTLPNEIWVSSSDEDAVTKECYRIFQEYEPDTDNKELKTSYQPPPQVEDDCPVLGKRRLAHEGAQNIKHVMPPKKYSSVPNPSQILLDRFQKVRESHAQAQIQTPSPSPTSALSSPQSSAYQIPKINVVKSPISQPVPVPSVIPGGKKRIAHVPNVSCFLDAKIKIQQKLKEKQSGTEMVGKGFGTSTIAQSVPKGSQRVAHMPSERTLTRPVVKGIGGKIPTNVRQNYLDILVDEYLKISACEQEAFEKAEEEERAINSRSTTRAIYASHVSNTVNRLRKAAQSNSASTSAKSNDKIVNRTVSHTSVLAGKFGAKGTWSIEKPRKPPESVVSKSLYQSLLHFALNEEQLKQNGFPMSHSEEKGVAVIHNFYKKPFIPQTPSQRMCARCNKIYYVNQQGLAVKEENCEYHWGRLFQSKTRGGWEARYNCCQGHGEAIGCSIASCHVSDNFVPNNLRGFVKTLPKDKPPPDGDYGVYALDCEMCYTTVGLELTRVTVIGSDLKVVYETLVKPESTILDYNTRFSGIKDEDLENVKTSIYEVQSVLLSFISDKTIIIGHSLESDFKALKLIHGTVVDTSVVYPHKMGPPKKKALKTLCRDLLQKIIQENEGGHDSAEDARAAMEIMLYKVKEDMKTAW